MKTKRGWRLQEESRVPNSTNLPSELRASRRSGPVRRLLVSASSSDLLPQNVGQRADYVCDGQSNPHTNAGWFDTACFAQPHGFRYGDSGVGEVFGPRYQNWDLGVYKVFAWGGS